MNPFWESEVSSNFLVMQITTEIQHFLLNSHFYVNGEIKVSTFCHLDVKNNLRYLIFRSLVSFFELC